MPDATPRSPTTYAVHEHDYCLLVHLAVDEDGSIFEVHRCACGQEEYALTWEATAVNE